MPGKQRGRRPGQKAVSMSSRCDLIFPAGRMNRKLKQGRYSLMTGKGGGIYMAAVLEYLAHEILELAGNASHQAKKKTISPRHLMLAMRNDEELNKLVASTTLSSSGVLPNVHGFLFGKSVSGAKAVTDKM